MGVQRQHREPNYYSCGTPLAKSVLAHPRPELEPKWQRFLNSLGGAEIRIFNVRELEIVVLSVRLRQAAELSELMRTNV